MGSDSGVGGLVRDRCDIRPVRRRPDALGGCTGVVGEGVGEIHEVGKLSSAFGHDGWFVTNNRWGGVGKSGGGGVGGGGVGGGVGGWGEGGNFLIDAARRCTINYHIAWPLFRAYTICTGAQGADGILVRRSLSGEQQHTSSREGCIIPWLGINNINQMYLTTCKP